MFSKARIKMIALFLLLVCIQTSAVAVIPHHHHHHEICLADDFDEEHGDSDAHCEDTCITHFKAVFQQRVSNPHAVNVKDESCFRGLPADCCILAACPCGSCLATADVCPVCALAFSLRPSPYAEAVIGRAPPFRIV